MTKIYSFDLSNYEAGEFVATRYPAGAAVGGDFVCVADSDDEAAAAAMIAAKNEWVAPTGRDWSDFTINFVNATP